MFIKPVFGADKHHTTSIDIKPSRYQDFQLQGSIKQTREEEENKSLHYLKSLGSGVSDSVTCHNIMTTFVHQR